MSVASSGEKIDVWQRMYEEQVRHARHHEILRAQSTNVIVAISAALIAFISSNSGALEGGFGGAFVAVVNLYGLLMSLKHYERSRLHLSVSGKYRDFLSRETVVDGCTINDARKSGRSGHSGRFWITRLRAYFLWCGLHLLLCAIGVFIVIQA